MNFGPSHYVPVLKIKRGEKKALRDISPNLKQRITPLLEIPERKGDKAPSIESHIMKALKDLPDSVRPFVRCFLDAVEIAPDGPNAAAELFAQTTAAGIIFTPVTGLSRHADKEVVLSYLKNGLAIRLTRTEMEEGDLGARIRRLISGYSISPDKIDLIVDLGPVNQMVFAGVAAMMKNLLAEIPDHGSWRTLTISACAFPLSMKDVDRNSFDFVDRIDWIAWRDTLHTRRGTLARLPTFSDCAIQHSKGVEGYDPRIMPVSATIRYALEDKWLLIKGESTRITSSSVQFPALAKRLVYGEYRAHFAGPSHCEGCRMMKDAADGEPLLGSPEAWRRLGTIHHLTTAMGCLDSLPWP